MSTESVQLVEPAVPALTLIDVTVTFPDGDQQVTALDAVSMTASPGTITAVVGESGCGKSTLLSVAAGMTVPDAGTVQVAGEDLSPGPGADDAARTRVRRHHTGMVFRPEPLRFASGREHRSSPTTSGSPSDATIRSRPTLLSARPVGATAGSTSSPAASDSGNIARALMGSLAYCSPTTDFRVDANCATIVETA